MPVIPLQYRTVLFVVLSGWDTTTGRLLGSVLILSNFFYRGPGYSNKSPIHVLIPGLFSLLVVLEFQWFFGHAGQIENKLANNLVNSRAVFSPVEVPYPFFYN